ncbi:hypothetical protein EON65_28665 [archaeon]|nr:MAG: hypothetical protein EON65_28665 [archaeon]
MLVAFAGASQSSCFWVNATTMVASLPSSSSSSSNVVTSTFPSVGDVVVIHSDTIRAACIANTALYAPCTSYPYVAALSAPILSPAKPIVPFSSLVCPNVVSSCSDFTIDPTASFGAIVIPWKAIKWNVTGNSLNLNNQSALSSFLNAGYRNTSSIVTIPHSFFVAGEMNITLTLTNLFEISSSTTCMVMITVPLRPQIIMSRAVNVLSRWKSLELVAGVLLPTCLSNTTGLTISYSWKVYMGTLFLPSLNSTSLRSERLVLPTYSLEVNTNYTFAVEVKLQPARSTVSASSSATLFVGRSEVSAIIIGGPARTVSSSQRLVLDASSSFDVDYPEYTQLRYTWRCMIVGSIFGALCPSTIGVAPNSAVWLIVPNTLVEDLYEFTVVVSSKFGATGTAKQTITVIEPRVPVVSVNPTQGKFSVDKRILLAGSISGFDNAFVAQWSNSIINISSVAVSPAALLFPAGTFSFNLALLGSSFVAGQSYTFSLTTSYVNSTAQSLAQVVIVMNQAPKGGVVDVLPAKGTALTTQFWCSTSQWSDDVDDYPLQYTLAYYVIDDSHLLVIKSRDVVTYASTVLGQGSTLRANKVTLIGIAYDIYDASANTSLTVEVLPIQSKSFAVTLGSTLLTNAARQTDANLVTQAISSSLPSINSVDCNVPTPCGSLNRANCLFTAKTCGQCISGFVGVPGDANTACSRNKLSIGLRCSSNSSCATSNCFQGICTDVPQECPNNCNGQGICSSYDYSGRPLNSCKTLDSCYVQCVCSPGFFGRDCGILGGAFSQLVAYRNAMCQTLDSAFRFQDTARDVIVFRAQSVAQILLDPTQVDTSGIQLCSNVLIRTVSLYSTQSCDDTVFESLTTAFANILQARDKLSMPLVQNITNALNTLSLGCLTNSVTGDGGKQLKNANIRLSNQVILGKDLDGLPISVARSPYEVLNNVPMAQIVSDISSDLSYSDVGIVTIQYTNNPGGTYLNSSSVAVSFSSNSAVQANRLLQINPSLNFSVLLVNTNPIVYTYLEESFHIANCAYRRDTAYYINVTCPEFPNLPVLCPADKKGRYNITCPSYAAVSRCAVWTGEEFDITPECTAIEFNTRNTTCTCSALVISNGRKLQAVSGDSTLQIGTLTEIVRTPLVAVFVEAQDDLVIDTTLAVISTLGAVFFTMILGVGLLWQRSESFSKGPKSYEKGAVKPTSKIFTRSFASFYNKVFVDHHAGEPWYLILLHRLLQYHSVLNLVSYELKSFATLLLNWLRACSKLIVLVFYAAVIVRALFADDGHCQQFTNQDACEASRVLYIAMRTCTWHETSFECAFERPMLSATLVAVLCGTVSILTAIHIQLVYAFIDHVVVSNWFSIERQAEVLPITQNLQLGEPAKNEVMGGFISYLLPQSYDEFVLSQSWRSTIFRAARLEKQLRNMDDVLPFEESSTLLILLKERMRRWKIDNAFRKHSQRITLDQFWYGRLELNEKSLLKRVEESRFDAMRLKQLLDSDNSTEEKEVLLMRHFFVNAFNGYQRNIVQGMLLDHSEEELEQQNGSLYQRNYWFYAVCYVVHMAVVVAGGYFVGMDIGDRSLKMWLTILFVTVLEELFCLEVFVIGAKYVMLQRVVIKDFFALWGAMMRKSRLILMRTGGMMRNSLDLVQHFNPACRAARAHPQWPVSRVLLSLQDVDMPIRAPINVSAVYNVQQLVYSVCFLFTYLPKSMQQVYSCILAAAALNVIVFALRLLSGESLGASIAIVIVLGLSTLLPVAHYIYIDFKKRQDRLRQINLEVFQDVDAILEEEATKKHLGDATFKLNGELSMSNEASQKPRANGVLDELFVSRKVSGSRPVSALGVQRISLELDESKVENVESSPSPNARVSTRDLSLFATGDNLGNALNWNDPLPLVQGPPLPFSSTRVSGAPLSFGRNFSYEIPTLLQSGLAIDHDFFMSDMPTTLGTHMHDKQNDDHFQVSIVRKADRPDLFSCTRRMRRIVREQNVRRENLTKLQLVQLSATQKRQRGKNKDQVFHSTLRQRMRRRNNESSMQRDNEAHRIQGPGRQHPEQLRSERLGVSASVLQRDYMFVSVAGVEDDLQLFGNLYDQNGSMSVDEPRRPQTPDQRPRSPTRERKEDGEGMGVVQTRAPGAVLQGEKGSKKKITNFPMYLH